MLLGVIGLNYRVYGLGLRVLGFWVRVQGFKLSYHDEETILLTLEPNYGNSSQTP